MDKIVPAFQVTLFDPTLSDACADMAELGIDSLLDDGIFKSLPIVSVLVGLGKTAQNIHDRNLLKQSAQFINTFNTKTISQAALDKHRNKLNNNPKFAEEELGRVVILLNSNVETKKSELLGKFYRAYVLEEIDWELFCEFAEITSKLFVSDLKLLSEIFSDVVTNTTQCQGYRAERLISLGLIDSAPKSISIGNIGSSMTQNYIRVNELGKQFCEIIQKTE
ncbi:MAG: hypothetical protein IJD40_01575 [Lachnospiraceae bacterium]|nr:hypothetical protein [Lachnospiraceae bacterium]